jgi:signal transduction histidine kinase
MSVFFNSLYGKISAVFLVLLLLLGVVQIFVSVNLSLNFVKESDQKLNRQLAHDLAKEFSPFLKDSIDYANIEHTIHELMVMNPRVEIYLLDERGTILAFFAEKEKIKRTAVSTKQILEFLSNEEDMPIYGDDPRNPHGQKPFSVAPIIIGGKQPGYLYVILGGEEYDSAAEMIRQSYIVRISTIALIVTLLFTCIVGLVLFAFLTKRFRRMTAVVREFAKGNLTQRISATSNDEIGALSAAFNHMADTIVTNIEEMKKTDNLRRELIANVSHDLRTPLALIHGYLETILMKDDAMMPQQRRQYLETIFANTKMLSNLVGELFELSKLDAKQTQPKPEPFSIGELVQDVVMKFQPQAEQRKVRLRTQFPHDLPFVYADIGMIERALSNLIDNALRYTEDIGVVTIELCRHNGSVLVKVSDTGYGIPSEDLPYLFERFYRVEKSRLRTSGGTGLGLAITKKMIEAHNSTITVESMPNVGTTFVFSLPIYQAR